MATSNNSAAPAITTILIQRPMRSLEAFGVVGSIMHLPEKEQPQAAGQQNHNTWIENREMPDFTLQLIFQEEKTPHERQRYCGDDAHHPCGEKTAEHVDGGRSATSSAHQAESQPHQNCFDLLHFESSCCANEVAGG